MDNRTMFHGETSGRRYAIGDVEQLTEDPKWTQPDYSDELNHDDMSFVGDSFILPSDAIFSYGIVGPDGVFVKRLTDPAVYHSLEVPFQRQ